MQNDGKHSAFSFIILPQPRVFFMKKSRKQCFRDFCQESDPYRYL